MTRVKICGITSVEAGLCAIDAGADYLGFVFYPPSSRYLRLDQAARLVAALRGARPDGWLGVGVFVNEPLEAVAATMERCGLDLVQLNGEETVDYIRQLGWPVIKAVRVGGPRGLLAHKEAAAPSAAAFGAERLLVDASVPGRYGGTGVAYDWAQVRPLVMDGFLAGGLTVGNVPRALAAARPWGVDVSSGVEERGVKSPPLIRAFLDAVREADRTVGSE